MKNWTIREATKAIIEGTDTDAIHELARHFPDFFMAVCKNDLLTLTNAMGEKMTVRRLDFNLTDEVDEEVEDNEAEADVPAAAKRAKKQTAKIEANIDEGNLEALSTKQLMALCDKRGIKVPHYGKNKQFYLDALNGAGDNTEAEAKTNDDPYAGMNAMQLFKACKEKGIKAEPKQKAAYYRDLLSKATAEPEATDDDDWDADDTEEVEEAPKATKSGKGKGAAKGGKSGKGSKKSKPEPEAEPEAEAEDEDDDWEI